ncbi:MAG: sulfatase-like hydrolase/transferase [Bacteroidetes bacterium]|nr:sulfatase-like hydrolase/transferase [Bacteroidota bacterium]
MTEKPNVLMICVDHWPGLLMGEAGNSFIETPTLDELCHSGVRFDQCYAQTPTCIPARRSIMTGTAAKTHGDRLFNETLPLPKYIPTLAECFRSGGYQSFAVGKMHVYPQRDRAGFDDVLLNEEGRHHLGMIKDDYEMDLAKEGYTGQELTHGMGNNEYLCRPWHLPEKLHPTNWTTRNMCRTIVRRDPTRPAFWYCSYSAPHPPVTPPAEYLNLYEHRGADPPFHGSWCDDESLPQALKIRRHQKPSPGDDKSIERSRMGFYAQCTYIDHQIRLLIGTLREEGLLDNTILLFTSDHGDMLGNHYLWAKPYFFEYSAKIPMILVDTAKYRFQTPGTVDSRLCGHEDILPTLLTMCEIDLPATAEGKSLVGEETRNHYYGEHFEDQRAQRMIRKGSWKLIYYPAGNHFHLFNLKADPRELTDLSKRTEYKEVLTELSLLLIDELYGSDLDWITEDRLTGMPVEEYTFPPNRGLSAQRGWRFS